MSTGRQLGQGLVPLQREWAPGRLVRPGVIGCGSCGSDDQHLEQTQVGPPPDRQAEAIGVGGSLYLLCCSKCRTFLTDRQSRHNAAFHLLWRDDGVTEVAIPRELTREEFVSGIPLEKVVAAARISYSTLLSPGAEGKDRSEASRRCELAALALQKSGDLPLALEFAKVSVELEERDITADVHPDLLALRVEARNRRADLANSIAASLGQQSPLYEMVQQAPGKPASRASSKKCFIATAASGSSVSPEVLALSDFRDRVLMESMVGRALVRLYYVTSPSLARLIASHTMARRVTLSALVKPAAQMARAVLGSVRAIRLER